MFTNDHPLLNLRGVFHDPLHSISSPQAPYPVEEIIKVFPVTREYVILVTRKSVHFLSLPHQEALWSILTAEPVLAAALAPDQPLLALTFTGATILWDLSRGQIRHRLDCPFSEADGGELAFGPGEMLAVAPMNEGVQLWDGKGNRLLHTLMDEDQCYRGSPKSLAFSPNGMFLAVGHADGHAVWLWRVADGQVQQMMDIHPFSHRIYGLAFSSNGTLLIGSEWSTDPEEESMSIWEIPSGKRVGKLPRMAWLPAVSPDGQFVASVDYDCLSLWDLAERRLQWQVAYGADTVQPVFSPDGRFLVSCTPGEAIWWSVQDGQAVYRLERVNCGRVSGMCSGNGQALVTRMLDGVVRVWNTRNSTIAFQVPFSLPATRGAALDLTGKQLVLWEDGSRFGIPPLHLFAPAQQDSQNFTVGEEQQIECVACHEESNLLAAGCTDRRTAEASISLWETPWDFPAPEGIQETQKRLAARHKPVHRFSGHTGSIRCLAFNLHGNMLASGADDQEIRLWNTGAREFVTALHGHTRAVTCLVFSSDGQRLVSGSKDGTVRVWDLASHQMLCVLKGNLGHIVSLAINEDGQCIGTVDRDQRICIWKIQGEIFAPQARKAPLTPLTHQASSLTGEPFPPGQLREGIHFWTFAPDGGTYQVLQERTQMLAVAFQADGLFLVAGYCWGAAVTWGIAQIDLAPPIISQKE